MEIRVGNGGEIRNGLLGCLGMERLRGFRRTDIAIAICKTIYEKRLCGQRVSKQDIYKRHATVTVNLIDDIVACLIRATIVASSRGNGGGYWLLASPQDTTLFEIVTAVEVGQPTSHRDAPGGFEAALRYSLQKMKLSRFF